jgi:hypothetical protein
MFSSIFFGLKTNVEIEVKERKILGIKNPYSIDLLATLLSG